MYSLDDIAWIYIGKFADMICQLLKCIWTRSYLVPDWKKAVWTRIHRVNESVTFPGRIVCHSMYI